MIFGRRIPALGPRGEGWVALQLLLIAAVVVASRSAAGSLVTPPVVNVAGGLLMTAGLVVVVVGALNLSGSFSIMPRPPAGAQLVTHGLYRYVRNPIYSGVIATTFGLGLGWGSWPALLLSGVLAGVLDLKTRREEVFLRERFPGYAAYAARTRKFIPGLY